MLKTSLYERAQVDSIREVSKETGEANADDAWDNSASISKLRLDDASEYGGLFSLGIALGGGGIIGIPVRIYPAQKFAIEAGCFFRPFFAFENEGLEIYPGAMLAGGFLIYPQKELFRGTNAKMQGLFLKGGHSFGTVPESFGALGWAMEKIKWAGSSFSVEVGGGVLVMHSDDPQLNYGITQSKIQPLLYWKVSWM